MMIHKIIPSVVQNYWLKRFNTQLNESDNENSLSSLKFLRQRMRKRYYRALGTSVINRPLSPLTLHNCPYLKMHNFNKRFRMINSFILENYLKLIAVIKICAI